MGYRSAPGVARPSEQLADLLMGRLAWDEAPEAIRSWAQMPIYQAAKTVAREQDKDKRRAMLRKIPEAIRPRVEDEVKRLWPYRFTLK